MLTTISYCDVFNVCGPAKIKNITIKLLTFCQKCLAHMIQQWTGNPKAADLNSGDVNFFALLVSTTRNFGGFFLGCQAGSFRPESMQTIKH